MSSRVPKRAGVYVPVTRSPVPAPVTEDPPHAVHRNLQLPPSSGGAVAAAASRQRPLLTAADKSKAAVDRRSPWW